MTETQEKPVDLEKLFEDSGDDSCHFTYIFNPNQECPNPVAHVINWKCPCGTSTLRICEEHFRVLKRMENPWHSICGKSIRWTEV